MAFHGEQKIQFYTIISIYTEAILSVILIPTIGIWASLGIMGGSIPLTLFMIKYYRLVLYKNIHEEVMGIPYWTGWIINRIGEWNYIDFGIEKKEEITITDKELDVYENEINFRDTLNKIVQDNEELYEYISEMNIEDEYVDKELSSEYQILKLTTSRQIYIFEMLRAFFEIEEKELESSIANVVNIYTKHPIPHNPDLLKDLNKFELIIYNILLIIKNITSDVITRNVQISDYLEKTLLSFGINDKIAYNNALYSNNIARLHNVERIYKNKEEIRKSILKNTIPLIFSLICSILAIIFIGYTKNFVDQLIQGFEIDSNYLIMINVFVFICFIPIILGGYFTFKQFKSIQFEEQKASEIHFNNILTKRGEFDNYCEIRKRLIQYSSDARIYKIYPDQKERQFWDNEYIYVILPNDYESSLEFDKGMINHKGYNVEVMTTPIVMLDIGSILGNFPVYLMLSCTYHFKRFTKIFYTYNLKQNWKDKAYLYIISALQSKITRMEPEKQSLQIRVNEWQDFATTMSQQIGSDIGIRRDEMGKVRSNLRGNQQQHDEEDDNGLLDNLGKMNTKKKKYLISGIVVGLIIFVIIFMIIVLTKLI